MLYYIKRILCWLGVPFTEICQRCGKQVGTIWHAPDYLWKDIINQECIKTSNYYNILCIRCFNSIATKYYPPHILYWNVSEQSYILQNKIRNINN
ncbi:hypothetical protein LCGC14_2506170 [marine sediment metagenome]|uniref:Uncharacterized protein n=1 Tax=marine sediment metagenome TaxID=412755 RepID=A0A0F9BNH7_9ZZZZ